MQFAKIIFITFTTLVPKSHTFINIGESDVTNTPTNRLQWSDKHKNVTLPSKFVHNYQGRRYLNDYDDDVYEFWCRPRSNFRIKPIRITNRIRLVPEIMTRIVKHKRRRPVSQNFYKVCIQDSPSFRLNHFVQLGGFKTAETNSSKGSHVMHQYAAESDQNKTFAKGTIFHDEALSGSPQRQKVSNDDVMALNDAGYARSNAREESCPGVLTSRGFKASTTKAEVLKLAKTDEEDAVKKVIVAINYGLLRGSSRMKNGMKADHFDQFDVNGAARKSPKKTKINIQIVKLYSESFAEPPHKMPSNIYEERFEPSRIEKGDNDTGLKIYDETIFKGKDASPRNETSYIMKLPKTNQHQGYTRSTSNSQGNTPEKPTSALFTARPTYPEHRSVRIFQPEQTPSSVTELQEPTKSEIIKPKSESTGYYSRNSVEGTSSISNREESPHHSHRNRSSGTYPLIPEKLRNNTFRYEPNQNSSPRTTTSTTAAGIRRLSKIYTLEDLLKWRKMHSYPVYGRHSSGEIVRRKMILDLKSRLVKNQKSLAENKYPTQMYELNKQGLRQYSAEQYCKGGNCRRTKRSSKSNKYLIQDYVYDSIDDTDDFPDVEE